jgi:hypothetical protein
LTEQNSYFNQLLLLVPEKIRQRRRHLFGKEMTRVVLAQTNHKHNQESVVEIKSNRKNKNRPMNNAQPEGERFVIRIDLKSLRNKFFTEWA